MLHLDILCSRHHFMPIWNQISDNSITIITSWSQKLCPLSNRHWIAAFLMLLHYVSTRAFCILWSIFIMDIDLCILTDRNHPTKIWISLITKFSAVAWPTGQTCHHWVMFLKLFHLGSILDIDSINTAITIANKEFSLSIIKNHRSQLRIRTIQPSIYTTKSTIFRIPYFNTIRMHGDKA